MLCTISGEIPKEAVISVKSGQIYEKALIEKYLLENDNKEPITHEEIRLEELIPIKQNFNTAPRPPKMSSIPSLLSAFQGEWDALMMEMFTLKQQYQQVRQQLTHALYQNDASYKVISRLTHERDEARKALAEINESLGSQVLNAANGSEEQELGLSDEIIEKLVTKSKELSKQRKKKEIPEGVPTVKQIEKFEQLKAVSSLHSTKKPGIIAIEYLDGFTATAGVDGIIQIFNLEEDQLIASIESGLKYIKSMIWCNETKRIFIVSNDNNNVLCFNPIAQDDFSSWALAGELPGHKEQVTSFSLNPTRQYAASTGLDKTWRLIDTYNAEPIATFRNEDNYGYTSGAFHPDGIYFAAGTQDAIIQIWNITEKAKIIDFEGHSGAITSITFSENGYYLATTSESNECKVWDLRKSLNIATITVPSNTTLCKFDNSGSYLTVVTDIEVHIYKNKLWKNPLVSLPVSAADITFSPVSDRLFAVSNKDSNLLIFGSRD